jgi:uncharacterized UPF0160 family protein
MLWGRKTIITHSGSFHTDDVFAVATLQLLLGGRSRVIRTREEWRIAEGDYVVDVGGSHDPAKNRFDHHQQGGAGKRSNGIPYASFGLVWQAYGEKLSGSAAIARAIDEKLVQAVDAIDNGVEISKPLIEGVHSFGLFDLISAFIPTWNEKEKDVDACFLDAVHLAEKLLIREIKRAKDKELGNARVEQAYRESSDKRLIVLDDNYSWGEVLSAYPEPLFVLEPVPQSVHWRVKTVRADKFSFENRKSLPASWAGLRDEALAAATGVPGSIFCHNARFIAVGKTKEAARALAALALDA